MSVVWKGGEGRRAGGGWVGCRGVVGGSVAGCGVGVGMLKFVVGEVEMECVYLWLDGVDGCSRRGWARSAFVFGVGGRAVEGRGVVLFRAGGSCC